MRRFMVLVFMIMLLFAAPAFAATVTFTWLPSDAPDLAGYRIYRQGVTAPIAEVAAGTETCTVEGIPDGDHTWIIRVVDLANQESIDSDPCSLSIDDPPGPVVGFG